MMIFPEVLYLKQEELRNLNATCASMPKGATWNGLQPVPLVLHFILEGVTAGRGGRRLWI